jgi:hypothetical protein
MLIGKKNSNLFLSSCQKAKTDTHRFGFFWSWGLVLRLREGYDVLH